MTKRRVRKPLQIQVAQPEAVESRYTWRTDWVNRYESSYSLLSKFAHLNGLGLQQLVTLFVRREPRGKVTTARHSGIDLISMGVISASALSTHAQLSGLQVQQASLEGSWDKGMYPWTADFRFCPACLAACYHSTLHQLVFLAKCPAHNRRLQTHCPQCHAVMPYRLTAAVAANPFCCPHCELPWAPALFEKAKGYPLLHQRHVERLSKTWKVLSGDRRRFGVLVNCSTHPAFARDLENGHQLALMARRREEFFSFLARLDRAVAQDAAQLHMDDQDLLQLHSGPMASHAGHGPAEKDTKITRPWFENDSKFWSVLPVYKAICRHFLHHVVASHRDCIAATVRHLWWHMEGRASEPICPVAYAFVMWRMFWEECGTPHQLMEPPRHAPYRILAWLSDAAPYCPATWPIETQEWLRHRVFAADCLATFEHWLARAAHVSAKRQMWQWNRHVGCGHMITYWAALESKTTPREVTVLMEPLVSCRLPSCAETGRPHYQRHLETLKGMTPYKPERHRQWSSRNPKRFKIGHYANSEPRLERE